MTATAYGLRQSAKAFDDQPETAAKILARAAMIEASENAERKRRQNLETCTLEVSVTVGDLAKLVRIVANPHSLDTSILETLNRVQSKIGAAQLELLGWEGERVEPQP
ncbi:MAG: hypothetical protein ACRDAM_12565 [Casimicrobium sp.]